MCKRVFLSSNCKCHTIWDLIDMSSWSPLNGRTSIQSTSSGKAALSWPKAATKLSGITTSVHQPESTNTQKKSKFRLRVVMVLSSQTCFCYVLQRYAHLGTHGTHQIASVACFPWHHAFQCSLQWSSRQGILSIFATKLHNLTVQTWWQRWHLTADLLVVLQAMCKDLGGIFAGHRLHVQHHLPHGWVHCLGSTRVYPQKI